MKTIYLAIQSKFGGEKKYKDVEIEVTDEQFQGLLANAEDNVVSNSVVNMFFCEWSFFLDEPLMVFAEELGLENYGDLPLSVDIRLDKPWQEALKEYLAELDKCIADGDTMAMLNKGYYYKHKVEDSKKAMECYMKAMSLGDENACEYILEGGLGDADDDTKHTVMDCIHAWIVEDKDLYIRTLRICSDLENDLNSEDKSAYKLLVDMANGNRLDVLQELGCIDFDFDNLIDKEVGNIIKYTDLGYRFLLQFTSETGSLKTIRAYFEHGVYVEKDEHMVEIIDGAIERLIKKSEDFEQKKYDFFSGDPNEPLDFDEKPQPPVELKHNAAEILMGSEDDTNYFLNWVVKQHEQKETHGYIASVILIFLNDLDLQYCNAWSVHRMANILKNKIMSKRNRIAVGHNQ